ncbi:MAG: helix-turn-helix domain-containing protein [Gemmatimonadales bacterium]
MTAKASEALLAPFEIRRHALGMSQDDVAKLAGITQTTLSTMVRGVGNPRLSSLQGAARALGMDIRVIPREILPYVDDLLRSTLRGETAPGETERSLYALSDDEDADVEADDKKQ